MSKVEFVSPEGLRLDGRRPNEVRRIRCDMGVLARADGSAYYEQGNTRIICAVYGPREAKNRADALHDRCIIKCELSNASFSAGERKDQSRMKNDRRSQELVRCRCSLICPQKCCAGPWLRQQSRAAGPVGQADIRIGAPAPLPRSHCQGARQMNQNAPGRSNCRAAGQVCLVKLYPQSQIDIFLQILQVLGPRAILPRRHPCRTADHLQAPRPKSARGGQRNDNPGSLAPGGRRAESSVHQCGQPGTD